MHSNVHLRNGTREHESVASGVAEKCGEAIDTLALGAQNFSHLAKLTNGEFRKRLYQAKSTLLSLALELDPAAFVVDSINVKQGSVGLERQDIRLHTPANDLSPAARAAVLQQIHKVLGAS